MAGDTSVLEHVEVDVNLEEILPCIEHPDIPATHQVTHPGCRFFVCRSCAIREQASVNRLIRKAITATWCSVCSQRRFDPKTVKITPIK